MTLVCQAIAARRLLSFDYNGLPRVVQPYCHGVSTTGKAVLRAIQIRGRSSSRLTFQGNLWDLSKMRNVALLDETFAPTDPHYNPDDSAMQEIHCRIPRGA